MSATVSRTADRWFVSIAVDVGDIPTEEQPHEVVGIDLGISSLMTLSKPMNGNQKIQNPRSLKKAQRKLRRAQKSVSRKENCRKKHGVKKSNRHKKAIVKLSKLYARVANIRKDTLHKATTLISKEFKVVCLEDLNVKGMLKNHKLASAISDASFFEIKRQLQYKKQLFGGHLICIDRWFPSSKCCSNCGVVVEELPLNIREWKCADCGSVHDRDINASINIEKVGTACPEPSVTSLQRTHRERIALVADVKVSNETNSLNCELHRSEQEQGR